MARSIRRIVVGVADLDGSDPNLQPAIELAEKLDARLDVVHGYYMPNPMYSPYSEMSLFSPESMEEIQIAVKARLERRVRELSESDKIACHAIPGPADVAVLDTATHVGADLLLVGATRRGYVGRAILGTTAQRILRAASCPVLVNRGVQAGPHERVLLTTDLSPISEQVQESAFFLLDDLVQGGTPEIRAVHVIDYDTAFLTPERPYDLEGIAEEKLRAYIRGGSSAPESISGSVRVGNGSREIVAEAKEWNADLIILGTHSRRGMSRFLIGSVAESVLRHAPCDALVIPLASLDADEDSASTE